MHQLKPITGNFQRASATSKRSVPAVDKQAFVQEIDASYSSIDFAVVKVCVRIDYDT